MPTILDGDIAGDRVHPADEGCGERIGEDVLDVGEEINYKEGGGYSSWVGWSSNRC